MKEIVKIESDEVPSNLDLKIRYLIANYLGKDLDNESYHIMVFK